MAYSDTLDKLGQIKMTNMNLIHSQIPHVKGDLAVRQGDGGSPYTAPPKEDPTRKYVPAPPKKASLTQQQMDSLNKVFPGAEGRINKFRKKHFNLNPMQIKPQGPQLPDLAMNFKDTGLGDGGFISTDKPNIYINSGAEAYILEPNGNFKFDGMYDPSRHGNAFPPLGLVQANDSMKIAKGFVKNVGEPIGVMSATQGMKIIDDTETNPLKKELRRIRMFKNNPIDPGLV
tara:strand:- start:92 stop:781 length:690 start_codon:yes stop_codon:yes gene_type:complete